MVFSFQFLPQQQLLTPLDVVNFSLASIGRDPVDSLVGNQDVDVGMILNELNAANLEGQLSNGDGWSFNSDESVSLSIASGGTVPLPLNTLAVRRAYASQGPINTPNVCERPTGLLYDQDNHTNIFTVAPVVDIIVLQDFTTIPQAFRNYIGRLAAFRFQGKKQGSQIVIQITKKEVDDALVFAQSHDDFSRPQNSINANSSVFYKLYGTGVRRNRGGQ